MCWTPCRRWRRSQGARRCFQASSALPSLLAMAAITVFRGAAVLVCGTFPDPTSGALSPAEVIIDMSGPAAPYCAFSDTANVVLVCHPAPRITNAEFDAALHRAKLKAAVYLARATAAIEPARRGALSSLGGGSWPATRGLCESPPPARLDGPDVSLRQAYPGYGADDPASQRDA